MGVKRVNITSSRPPDESLHTKISGLGKSLPFSFPPLFPQSSTSMFLAITNKIPVTTKSWAMLLSVSSSIPLHLNMDIIPSKSPHCCIIVQVHVGKVMASLSDNY